MSKGQTLQDPFLNSLRKDRIPVSIFLVNGIKLQGQIESFDQYVVLLKNTVSQMVYKHAISTVVPARNPRSATTGVTGVAGSTAVLGGYPSGSGAISGSSVVSGGFERPSGFDQTSATGGFSAGRQAGFTRPGFSSGGFERGGFERGGFGGDRAFASDRGFGQDREFDSRSEDSFEENRDDYGDAN